MFVVVNFGCTIPVILLKRLNVNSNEPHAGTELLDNLRRKQCCWCDSERLRPFFAIEQESPSSTEYWHTIIALCDDCKRGQMERTYNDSSDWERKFDQTEWYMLDETSVKQLCDFIGQTAQRFAPCTEPLSPKCLCEVHWHLTEAAKRLESMDDEEIQKRGGLIVSSFSINTEGLPAFCKSI